MNKHSIALLAILVLMGVGLFAMVNYQRGKALPPVGAATAAKGGLVINGISVPAAGAEIAPAAAPALPAAAPALPAAAEAAGTGASCP